MVGFYYTVHTRTQNPEPGCAWLSVTVTWPSTLLPASLSQGVRPCVNLARQDSALQNFLQQCPARKLLSHNATLSVVLVHTCQ